MKIIICVSLLLLYTIGGASAWYDGFDYRIPITINNTGNLPLEDYQFNVSFVTGINESSIRVVNELYGSTVPHWCENKTNGLCYELWFNTSVGSEINTDYYIYYGCDAVVSTSDYDNTFTKSYNTSGLVLELHMDEGTGFSQTNDTSGEGNHGTLTNMNTTGNATSGWQGTDGGQWDNRSDVVFADGDHLRFDGTDDYVDCGNDASFNITSVFTTSTWCFIPPGAEQNDWTSLIQKDILADGDLLYGVRFTSYGTNTISTVFYNGATYKTSNSTGHIGYPLSTGVWHHVAGVYDGNTIFLYVDGIDREHHIVGAQIIPTSAFPVTIGKQKYGVDRFINGSIDEVRIYNRALSEDEIYRQYIRSKYAPTAPTISFGEIEKGHEFVIGATSFYDELTGELTDFRDSMGKYLVWGILFFAIGLAFTLFAKIKQTLIGGK